MKNKRSSAHTREIVFPSRVAEIRVTYSSKIKDTDRPKVSSSADAVEVLRCKWSKGKLQYVEEFKVILLNRDNRVLGVQHVSLGGVAGTVADPKVIFAAALKTNASALILAHSHPSGSLKASKADRELTAKLIEAGRFLELPVLDHIIITKDSYLSFADEGILW